MSILMSDFRKVPSPSIYIHRPQGPRSKRDLGMLYPSELLDFTGGVFLASLEHFCDSQIKSANEHSHSGVAWHETKE
jgi:hypothetical protein